MRIFLPGLIFLCANALYPEPAQYNLCNLQFAAPVGANPLQESSDLIVWEHRLRYAAPQERTASMNVEWVFTCVPNASRTNRVTELQEYYARRGEQISNYQEFPFLDEIAAARYQRLRIARKRKLLTQDIFFATRDHEFLVSIVPDASRSLIERKAFLATPEFQSQVQYFLKSSRMVGDYQTTITEAAFRWRLRGVLLALCSIVILVVFLLFRRHRKKR